MKTSLILRTLLLASMFAGNSAQAADPQLAPATPDIAKLMAMLNQLVADTSDQPAPALVVQENPAPPVAPAPQSGQRPTTSSLRVASLAISAPLGGRGTAPNVPKTESNWRALFPLK